MRSVKMLTEVRDVSRAAGDRWYVTNGTTAVGPVNFELLARGIEAGKVPLESFIRHEAWTVWKPLAEVALVTNDTTDAPLDADEQARSALSPYALYDSSDRITSPGPAESPRVSPRPSPSDDEPTSPGRPAFSFDPALAAEAVYRNIPLD